MKKKNIILVICLFTFSISYSGWLDQLLSLANLGAGPEPTDIFDQIEYIEEGHRQGVISTYQASRRPPCLNTSAVEIIKGSILVVASAIGTGWIIYHHGNGDFDHPLFDGLYFAPAASATYGLKMIGNGLSNAPATKAAQDALKAWAPFASSAIKLKQLKGEINSEQAELLEDAVEDIEAGVNIEDMEMETMHGKQEKTRDKRELLELEPSEDTDE